MSDLRGKSIRGYELKEPIGSGGFGAVYRAWQPSVDREVALKVILPEFATHPDFVARFEAEARTVAKLEHPHIVPLYDYWHDDEGAFLVMRYLKGGSLRERLEASGPLAPEEVGRVLEEVCGALSAAHESGVVRRDLKPENVLLDERGDAYLTDFGIAKDLSTKALTKTGGFMGSAAYIAPEQARGDPVGPQSDIYTLGILIFELLTGEHPFSDLGPVQLIERHLNQNLPSAAALRANLPTGIDALIQKATAKDPEHRHASAAALREAYSRILLRADAHEAAPAASLPAFLKAQAEPRGPVAVFVGRDRELARLKGILGETIQGRGRVAFLAGGAGQGKTALARAFSQSASGEYPNLIVLTGDCNAQAGIGDPYLPFREILAGLTGDLESKWAAGTVSTEMARRLWEGLPETVRGLTRWAPDVVDLMLSGSQLAARAALAAPDGAGWRRELEALLERKAAFQGTTRPQQVDLFEQVSRLLGSVAERSPLLLILDDFQWADDASISLLFHLGRRISGLPILILCAYRPDEVALGRDGERHPLEPVLNELVRLHGEEVIDLAGSSQAEGGEFIDALLETEPNRLGPEFRQALHQHSGGHPLFTVELLRAMQERGDLQKDQDGRWVEAPTLAWDQLPARVEAVIEERIGRLEEELRELLSMASVEGQDFTVQVLARIRAVEERQVFRELSQELQKRHRLVRELGEARAGNQVLSRYQFAHHLFQRYLYNELGAGERRLLHGEIARCLEDIFGEQAPQIAVQLAFHYGRANLPQNAARYLRLAGDQAKSSYANQEAIRHYTELLPLLPSPSPELFDVLAARAAVYELIGRSSDQYADVEAMLPLARQLGDQARLCDALLALADYQLGKEHVLAQEPAEAALEIARHLDDPVREGAALRRLGWLEWLKEDYSRSRQLLELAVEKFRAAGQLGEAATTLHTLSLSLGALTEYHAALRAAQEAVELSREVGDRRQGATGLRRVAIAHMDQDRHEEALPFAEQALAMHQEVGDAVAQAAGHNVLGCVRAWLRDFGASEHHLRRSLELARLARDTNAITNAIDNLLTMHYRRRGEYEAGLRLVEGTLEEAVAAKNEWLVGRLHFVKGYELELLGCAEHALSTYQIALSIFDRLAPRSLWTADIASCQSRCHADLGHLDIAWEAIDKARALAESVGDPLSIAFAQFVRAYVILLNGDPGSATTGLDLLSDAMRVAGRRKHYRLLEYGLNTAGRLHLALGNAEEALPLARDLMGLIDRLPLFDEPQQILYTLAQTFGALGQDDEAMGYLRRAYAWVTMAAEKMQDAELKRSWLEKHPRNCEILAAAAQRGIV